MNERKKANKCILSFIESGLGMEDGISRLRADLFQSFRFSDETRFSRQALRDCYAEFENWLNSLMIAEPPPDGVAAMFFGLYKEEGRIGISLSGSRRWSLEDPAWACDTWYLPEGGQIEPDVYADICSVSSEFNHTGLYLSITILAAMIREFTEKSMISLLDINRKVLYLACGFVDGDLYNVGKLTNSGLQAPRRGFRLFG